MKHFLLKTTIFFLTGFLPLLLSYIILDPFKVLRSYDTYYDSSANGWVGLNRDHLGCTLFLRNYKSKCYNSFIFGNSRSLSYHISDWEKHLPENSACFHYDASGETIWAIGKKIELLNKKGVKIENVLLVLDNETLSYDKPKSGHLHITSPVLVNYKNFVMFHWSFLKAFLTPEFLFAFFDFKFSGTIKPYMEDKFLFDNIFRNHDIITNNVRYDQLEDLIKKDKYYTTRRLSFFWNRDTIQKSSLECLKENHKRILYDIHSIFNKHRTNVKVVINPLYDQLKFNINDLEYLKTLFGKENVFDFSGINNFTQDFKNYYDNSHYRPHVAKNIMEILYNDINKK